MSTHTPAPWVLDGLNMSTVLRCTAERGSPEAKHICGDYEVIAECRGDNWEANSRLISAAPEMLGALRDLLFCIEHGNGLESQWEIRDRAHAAIARAEGRA